MAATNWCGTLHLGDEEFFGESWLNQMLGAGKITYGIGQIERCPETGRRHFQFYVQVGRTQKLAWMRRHISDKAHFEQARGNVQQNIDYCSKQDSRLDGPWEVGIAKRQGQTTGLAAATDMIASGAAVCEVAKLYPLVWVRHGKGLVHLRQVVSILVVPTFIFLGLRGAGPKKTKASPTSAFACVGQPTRPPHAGARLPTFQQNKKPVNFQKKSRPPPGTAQRGAVHAGRRPRCPWM